MKKLKQIVSNLIFMAMGIFIIVRPILWPDNRYLANLRGGILLFSIAMTILIFLIMLVFAFLDAKVKDLKPHERKSIKSLNDIWKNKNRAWETMKWVAFLVGYVVVGEWWFVILSLIQRGAGAVLRHAGKELTQKIVAQKYDDAEEADFIEIKST